jgi:hypothetical protein
MSSVWTNSDGLVVKFGPRSESDAYNKGEAVSVMGVEQEIKLRIKGTLLADATIPSDFMAGAKIPAGSLIVSSTVLVNEAFAGTNAVLHIGTYDSAGSVVDADGLNSHAVGALTADTDVAGAGALIGTVVTADTFIAATYETAAFTAGYADVLIKYIKQTV